MITQFPQIFHNPFLWGALSAIFLGAATAKITVLPGKSSDPDRMRTVKWIFVCVYLSFAVVFALAGAVSAAPEDLANRNLLYFCLILTAFFALAFRFKKSVGIAAFFLILTSVLLILLFVQSLVAFTGETEIAQVHVLDIAENRMKLELAIPAAEPVALEMDGEYFAPVVKVVVFNDYFVFLGAKSWYRFVGITSFLKETKDGKTVFRQADTDYYIDQPTGISDSLYTVFERFEDRIPWVKSAQVEIDAKKARALKNYSIRIQNDGGIQIIDTTLVFSGND